MDVGVALPDGRSRAMPPLARRIDELDRVTHVDAVAAQLNYSTSLIVGRWFSTAEASSVLARTRACTRPRPPRTVPWARGRRLHAVAAGGPADERLFAAPGR
jgi:hypothetical protein